MPDQDESAKDKLTQDDLIKGDSTSYNSANYDSIIDDPSQEDSVEEIEAKDDATKNGFIIEDKDATFKIQVNYDNDEKMGLKLKKPFVNSLAKYKLPKVHLKHLAVIVYNIFLLYAIYKTWHKVMTELTFKHLFNFFSYRLNRMVMVSNFWSC
jgi:hypothetical protein